MRRNLNIALAIVAGLLGGLLTRYIAPPAAFAQNQPPTTKEIRAQSFTLVDPLDRTVGTFTFESAVPIEGDKIIRPPGAERWPMRIVLRDSNGREIWSAGGTPFRRLSER
jgi:hypothetical protein